MRLGDHRKEWLAVAVVFGVVLSLYVLVGRWGNDANVDVLAVSAPAWRLATSQTLESSFMAERSPWIVEDKEGRLVSNRPPGLIAFATPAYAVTQPDRFSNAPSTAMAILASMGALATMHWTLRRIFGWSFSLLVVGVLALGTTTWTTSAAQLWPHGPGQLAAALAIASMSANGYLRAGLAFAAGILIRPITMVFPLVVGIHTSWTSRSFVPAARVGATSMLGLMVLLVYNRRLFGAINIRGGYPETFTTSAIHDYELADHLANFGDMLFTWPNGLLLFSPIVGVATIGTLMIWRTIPSWVRSSAWAALAYLVVHAALNRASGGMPIFYRYPLEPLVLATPALAFGIRSLWETTRSARLAIGFATLISVAIHFANAFWTSCLTASPALLSCQVFGLADVWLLP